MSKFQSFSALAAAMRANPHAFLHVMETVPIYGQPGTRDGAAPVNRDGRYAARGVRQTQAGTAWSTVIWDEGDGALAHWNPVTREVLPVIGVALEEGGEVVWF